MSAFGGSSAHVDTLDALRGALRGALSAKRPTLIDVVIDPLCGTESGSLGAH